MMQLAPIVRRVDPPTRPLANRRSTSRSEERVVSSKMPQDHNDPLSSRIEKLALEERDAVRRRDWPAAKSAAEEKAVLQEARHRSAARRLT